MSSSRGLPCEDAVFPRARGDQRGVRCGKYGEKMRGLPSEVSREGWIVHPDRTKKRRVIGACNGEGRGW